jgi:hypothetical protein
MRSLAWSAIYSIRVPEGVSACSNANAANAPGAIGSSPHGHRLRKQTQVAIRASSDRNGQRVTAFQERAPATGASVNRLTAPAYSTPDGWGRLLPAQP